MRLLCLSAVTLLLGGCLFGKDDTIEPPAELVSYESSLPIKKLWSIQVGKNDEDLRLALRPALLDDRLLVASSRGSVRAVELDRGRSIWSTNLDLTISGAIAASDQMTVVGTLDGQVIALSSEDGKELWRARASSEILAPAAIGSGMVIVRSQDGRLFGFDATSGTREWVFDQSTPTLTLRGNSPPLLTGGFVFVGFDNGKLFALRARDGSLAWEATIGAPTGRTELDRMVDVDGQMVVVGGDLYAVGFHGRLVALSADAGRAAWNREFSSRSGVSISRRQLFLTDDEDAVWALDRFSGGTLWRQDRMARRELTTPVPHGDAVVVGDFDGYLHWMSTEDGSFVARSRVADSAIVVPPVVAGNIIYVTTQSGRLVALRAG